MFDNEPIAALRITVALPEQMRSWSHSEITRPETIDCRTLQPVKDGLFCERIFGPTQNWTCFCGTHQRERTRLRCEVYGMEITTSSLC
jgi:DNA-directed RNA polymerase subunit beta'